MGDVADILGFETKDTSLTSEASKILAGGDKGKLTGKGLKKPKGMSREVFGLLGQDSITSSLQPAIPAVHLFKSKRNQRNKWIWAPVFTDINSNMSKHHSPTANILKNRNNPKLHHWMKSELQNCEYPYLKFDIQIDRITFTDEEYEAVLRNDKWTQSESEYLIDLCYNYDLRWPVIFDRYNLQPSRRPEDIQDRFYSMISLLRSHRSNGAAGGGGGGGHSHDKIDKFPVFNVELERNRKIQQELLFHKTKQEAIEESEVKEELKLVDAALKKTKRSVKNSDKLLKAEQPSLSTSSSSSSSSSSFSSSSSTYGLVSSSSNNNSNISGSIHGIGNTTMNEMNTDIVTYSAPGKPALQSSRFFPADFTTNLSKNLFKKLNCLLKELGLAEKMLPTKTICDLYDQVRRDGVALLSLQNAITKKEKEISLLKLKNSVAAANNNNNTSMSTTETDPTVKLESGGAIPPTMSTAKNATKNSNNSSSGVTSSSSSQNNNSSSSSSNSNSNSQTITQSAGVVMTGSEGTQPSTVVTGEGMNPTATTGGINPKKGQKRKKSVEKPPPQDDDLFTQLTTTTTTTTITNSNYSNSSNNNQNNSNQINNTNSDYMNNNSIPIIPPSSSSSSSIAISNDSVMPASPKKTSSKKVKSSNPPVQMQL